jgi:hypothetical protein
MAGAACGPRLAPTALGALDSNSAPFLASRLSRRRRTISRSGLSLLAGTYCCLRALETRLSRFHTPRHRVSQYEARDHMRRIGEFDISTSGERPAEFEVWLFECCSVGFTMPP